MYSHTTIVWVLLSACVHFTVQQIQRRRKNKFTVYSFYIIYVWSLNTCLFADILYRIGILNLSLCVYCARVYCLNILSDGTATRIEIKKRIPQNSNLSNISNDQRHTRKSYSKFNNKWPQTVTANEYTNLVYSILYYFAIIKNSTLNGIIVE